MEMSREVEMRSCPECGTVVAGRYCAGCGQEAELELPTFGEFVHEFIGDHVALESKLLRTIVTLVRRPGMLTVEYVAGRRQRYVRPLRLYLTLSLLFFLVLGLTSKPLFYADSSSPAATPKEAPKTAQVSGSKVPAEKAAPSQKPTDNGIDMRGPGGTVFQADDTDTTGSVYLDSKIHSFSKLPETEKSRALTDSLEHGAPYAIFVLMPLFAAGLKLLYFRSGRTYGEHFLFALHAQSYSYLALLMGRIGELPFLRAHGGVINIVVVISMIVYLYLAMRRFYGSQRWSTLWRVSLLLGAYGMLLGVALALATLTAVVT
jgi:hypothetical protein